jgi:predicted DNA-binding ribbon-helix-helix protein
MADERDGPVKRSITVAGHRTSISLEEEFWTALAEAAAIRNLSVAALVAQIDEARGGRNLSSAVRVFLLREARGGR